jgi:1,4-dihydroxy-2-naphthoate octaprenyltransferase
VKEIDLVDAVLIFFILHLLVYPASNGYNSYMDRDIESIGGVKNPLPPTGQLFLISGMMDLLAFGLSCLISKWFASGILLYILASRAYSFRGIRLKKYPLTGYLTVIIFQGGMTFFLVYHGCSIDKTALVPIAGIISSSLLIGGFYPLTQIYQHDADRKDGVISISSMLGYKGTFIFTGLVYGMAMATLFLYFFNTGKEKNFYIIATAMLPVLVYFFMWASEVWKNRSTADFIHAMRMNILASVCTNIAFLIILTGRLIE